MKLNVDQLNKYFGVRLKSLRESIKLTQTDIAKLIGVTKATISRYENGLSSPGVSEVKVLSDFFNVSPFWLAGMSDDKYIKAHNQNKVPIIGYIAAGAPLFATENILGYEHVSENENVDFCLVIKGDSMINARIFDGDIVYIRQQPDVENGEIAAVLIDDEATLKRVYKINGNVILRPENLKYKDITLNQDDYKQITILGKAVAFKSKL